MARRNWNPIIIIIVLATIAFGVAGASSVFALKARYAHEAEMGRTTMASAAMDRLDSGRVPPRSQRDWVAWLALLGLVSASTLTAATGLVGKAGLNGLVSKVVRLWGGGRRAHSASAAAPAATPPYVWANQPLQLATGGMIEESEEEEDDDDSIQWTR